MRSRQDADETTTIKSVTCSMVKRSCSYEVMNPAHRSGYPPGVRQIKQKTAPHIAAKYVSQAGSHYPWWVLTIISVRQLSNESRTLFEFGRPSMKPSQGARPMPPPRGSGQVRSKTPLPPGRGFRLVLSHTPAGGDINLASKHQARHKSLETHATRLNFAIAPLYVQVRVLPLT